MRFFLIPAVCLAIAPASANDSPARPKDAFSREAAMTKMLELSDHSSRFHHWMVRCQLRALTDDNETVDPKFLSEFGFTGAKARQMKEAMERFIADIRKLDTEMLFRGDAENANFVPSERLKGFVEYLETPKRIGEQALLARAHAADLAEVLGDSAMALAIFHITSHNHNHFGKLAIAHPIYEAKDDNGNRVFKVRRVLLSSVTRHAMGEGSIVASADSLEKLPSPFGEFFRAEKRIPPPSDESILAKVKAQRIAESRLRPAKPGTTNLSALSPLLNEHLALAEIVMKHTDVINFTGKTDLGTLLDIGVSRESMEAVGKTLNGTVAELTRQLKAKNPDIEPLQAGSKVTIHGLAAEEHKAVVDALEAELAKKHAGKLAEYLARAFAKSTRVYTNRWDITVENHADGIGFFPGGSSTRTRAIVTDLEGNKTKTRQLGYPLRFLEYAPPQGLRIH